jgi:hypothetical protein
VITGFNTDIPHEGVTYHVQTEDKGLDTPLILSLVYVGGAIIASKRTTYEDLIAEGFDEQVLTERLQRQHKLICAAIRAGRVEDLRRMGEHEAAREPAAPEGAPAAKKAAEGRAPKSGPKAKAAVTEAPAREEPQGEAAPAAAPTPKKAAAKAEAPRAAESVPAAAPQEAGAQASAAVEELYLSLLDDEGDFRAGQLATVKIHVGRGAYGRQSVADAEVIVKVLGTTFRPIILNTNTDADGLAVVRALLPRFTSGRAAIIIRASDGGEMAELRRIIHQS